MDKSNSKTCLVTGGNRGLGLETCRQLARRGFRVTLTSRLEREGEAAVRRLEGERLEVSYHQLDVADEKSIARLAGDLKEQGFVLDVLVNNAGVGLEELDVEVARRTLDINFFGPLRVTDALLPLIPDGGNIVMVSSGMGELSCVARRLRKRFTNPHLTREQLKDLMHAFVHNVEEGWHAREGWPSSPYRVSKVGLNALTRILARDLADRRILVNAVSPGWVRTDMGGPGAPRSVEEGAASIVWAAVLEDGPTGGFFRDGRAVSW